MICIYEANETSWHGNGLCVLQPSSCTVTEIAGGDFSLTLVHPITEDLRWKELQEERIIKAPVPAYRPLEDDGTVIVPAEQATEQCFRIYSSARLKAGMIDVMSGFMGERSTENMESLLRDLIDAVRANNGETETVPAVNVENMVMANDMDAQSLAAQISAMTSRRQHGYGY